MATKEALKKVNEPEPRRHDRNHDPDDKPYPPPEEPRSKALPFDTGVPGDRGNCEKQSLTQGSE